jgi:hypothetical protein
MYENNMYKYLVFYLESCESGSMFNGLLQNNLNIYAVTASTPFESSYACNPSTFRKTYLSDCFSLNWMKNSRSWLIENETLEEQFLFVRNKTKGSTVCQYGELNIRNMPVSDFLSYPINKNFELNTNDLYYDSYESTEIPFFTQNYIDSRDVELYNVLFGKVQLFVPPNYMDSQEIKLYKSLFGDSIQFAESLQDIKNVNYMYVGVDEWKELIQIVLDKRRTYDTIFKPLVNKYKNFIPSNECYTQMPKLDYECYRNSINVMEQLYGKFTPYGMKYFKYLAYECMDIEL